MIKPQYYENILTNSADCTPLRFIITVKNDDYELWEIRYLIDFYGINYPQMYGKSSSDFKDDSSRMTCNINNIYYLYHKYGNNTATVFRLQPMHLVLWYHTI